MPYKTEKENSDNIVQKIIGDYPGIGFDGIVKEAKKLPEDKRISRPTVDSALKRLRDNKKIIKLKSDELQNYHKNILNNPYSQKTRLHYFLTRSEIRKPHTQGKLIFLLVYDRILSAMEEERKILYYEVMGKEQHDLLKMVENKIIYSNLKEKEFIMKNLDIFHFDIIFSMENEDRKQSLIDQLKDFLKEQLKQYDKSFNPDRLDNKSISELVDMEGALSLISPFPGHLMKPKLVYLAKISVDKLMEMMFQDNYNMETRTFIKRTIPYFVFLCQNACKPGNVALENEKKIIRYIEDIADMGPHKRYEEYILTNELNTSQNLSTDLGLIDMRSDITISDYLSID